MTTTSTGALKEGIRDIEHDLGVYALGGKEATSRKTPTEILDRCKRLAVDPGPLLNASRLAAKVVGVVLQDGYQLDHHSFFSFRHRHAVPYSLRMSGRQRISKRCGTPLPVDRATYDRTIDTLHRAMAHAKVDRSDRVDALKRLGTFAKNTEPSSHDIH